MNMKVGLAQINPLWENRAATKAHILTLLEKNITPASVDWLIFPEMTLSGFSMNQEATTLDDSDVSFFRQLAQDYQTIISYGGVVDGKNGCFTVNANQEQVSRYEKTHLFSYATEDQYYTPGDKLTTFSQNEFQITPTICYDLRFANLFWQTGPQTDIFVVMANWPASRLAQWQILLKARAIENQCFVIGVNRVGADPNVTYAGGSGVFAPTGETLLEPAPKEGIFAVELSKQLVLETRSHFPFLKDRRVDL
ncbi:MAG TPA: hypothetical protein ENI48_08920 [Thioploca sp.]|nr:hypothetical protein [Thioploca sp.]